MQLEKREKTEHVIEIIVVVLMGLAALLTAWATWIGSLHGGNQATNYTTSNNIASEGNSEYNAGVQSMTQDMMLWNEISDMQIDYFFAENKNDTVTLDSISNKLFVKLSENLTSEMAEAIGWEFPEKDPASAVAAWLEKDNALSSPFGTEGFEEHYFVAANELLEESASVLEQGKKDNANADSFGLVTVIYSVALFLLGMVSTLKGLKNKYGLLAISVALLLTGAVYMLTIPMPTGFSFMSFFGA